MAEKPAPAAADADDFFRALDTQLLVHELKGPLALIEAAARTLIEQTGRLGPLTERQEKAVRRILRGSLRGKSSCYWTARLPSSCCIVIQATWRPPAPRPPGWFAG